MPSVSLVFLVLPAVFLSGSGQVTYVQVEPYSSGFNVTWDGTETELYEILYSATNDSLSATSVSTPVNVTSVVVGRLLPGTLYYVWVNETSTNTLSDVATVTTYSVPGKVTGLKIQNLIASADIDRITVEIIWNEPPSDFPIRRYEVQVDRLPIQGSTEKSYTIDGIRNSEQDIKVRAVSVLGEGEFSDVLTVTVGDAPAVPMVNVFELTAIDRVIYLNASWEAVEGADFYRIRLSSETFNTTETSLLTETMQEGLASLSAVSNLYGEGDGAQFNLTAPELAISRVTGLNLTILLGDTQVIEATWNPLTEDISAYAIFVNSTSGEDFTFEVPSSQTSFNLTSVEAGFEYRFEVAGRREDDLGPNGIKSIQSYDVPEQVTDLTVIPGVEEGEPVILIRWTAPRSDAGIMNYIILYGVSSSELMQNVSIPANLEEPQMFFNITGELGTDYSVQLAAVSVLGTGPFSNVTQITTFDVPGAVINLVGMPATSDGRPAVTLSWVEPDSDAPILQYTVRYGVGNSEPLSERTVSNLSLLVTDLELATEYYFSVYASSELGDGLVSNTTTTIFNVPGAVTNLVGMPATSDGRPAVTLSWVEPDSDEPILQYTVRYGVGNSEPLSERTVSNLSLLVTDLELATEYYFSVYASSELGDGLVSNTTTTTFNVPGVVSNLVGMPATSDGRPAVTLSWVEPDSDVPILQYTVRYGVGNSEPLSERTVSNLSLLVTDLELATEYYFSVYASSELGDGLVSNTTTTTFNVPGAVISLVGMPATSDGRPAVTLSWVEPDSDVPILQYTVRYGVGNSEPLSERTVSNLSLLVTDLELATEYYFSVYASSELGNGSINNFTVVTTFNVPGPVINLDAIAGLEFIRLTWMEPENIVYHIFIGYNIYLIQFNETVQTPKEMTSYSFPSEKFAEDQTYTAEVFAISEVGLGPSEVVSFKTIAGISLSILALSPYSLRVAWDDFGVSATKLVLSIEEKEVTTDHVKRSGHIKSFDLLPSNSSFIISDIKSNTPYIVTLQALDSNDSVVAYGSSQVRTPFGDCPATLFVPRLSSFSSPSEHTLDCSEIHPNLRLGGEITWRCINGTLVVDASQCFLRYRANRIIITEWEYHQNVEYVENNKMAIIDEESANLETNYGDLGITVYSLNVREADEQTQSVLTWVFEVPPHVSLNNLTMTFLAGVKTYYLIQSTDYCECKQENDFTLNSAVDLCRIPDSLEAPCTCMEDICNCNQPFVEIGNEDICGIDLDVDRIPDVEDPCIGCCNSEQSHLLTWPETLTGSTALLSCSLLSQAFNEKAYITRHCLSNGTWSNEDSTDCTFKPDTEPSTSVLLGVVTSTSDSPLTVEDFTSFGLSADILKFSEQENRELSTNYSFSITVNFPVDREYLNELGANLSSQGVRLLSNSIYGYIANSTCACPLSFNLMSLGNGRCIGPPGPTCLCSSDTCECQSPYARVDGLGDLYCEVDSDGDGVADSQDVCPNHYGRTPPCSVTDSKVDCPSETDQYGLAWPGARSGETVGQACSENGNLCGIVTRECSDHGEWGSPSILGCEDVTLRVVIETIDALVASLEHSSIVSDVTVSAINTAIDVLLNATSANSTVLPTSLNVTNSFLAIMALYAEQTDLFTHNQYNPMDLFQITDNMLDMKDYPGWGVLDMDAWSGGSPLLLMSVETIAKALSVNTASNRNAMTLPDGAEGVVFQGDFITVQASLRTSLTGCPNSDGKDYTDILYPAEADLPFIPQSFGDSESLPQITIPGALLQERVTDNCQTVPVFNLIFRNFSQLLPREYNDGRSFGNYETESYVISSQVADVGQKSNSLKNEPVLIEFPLTSSRVPTSARCVFWNFTTTNPNSHKVGSTQLGGWSDGGVVTEMGDKIICKSQHLTSFAVLVDYTGVELCGIESTVFSILTYIGCGISIVCLVITIIFFFSLKRDIYKNVVHFVHVNFSIALLIALIIFVGGVSHAGTIKEACTVVSVLLHYFFLSSFTWMLCEGIMLYMLLVKVFGAQKRKWLYLYSLIGWGLPVPIVVVSIAVRHNQYYSVAKDCDGNDINLCWLPSENGLIWAFLAPVIIIILVNIIFAVLAMRRLVKFKKGRYASKNTTKSTEKLFWYALKSFAIILPLLGLTWLFGILAANPWNRGLSIAFSCLFIIFNSLQGFFIFLFHVVRHDKVYDKLKKCCASNFPSHKTEQTQTGTSGKQTMGSGTAEALVISVEGMTSTLGENVIPMKEFVKDSSNLQKEWSVIVNKHFNEEKNEKDSEEADTQGEDQLETKEQEVDKDEKVKSNTDPVIMETPEIMDEESKPVSKEKEANPEITTDPEKETETSRDPEANSKITTCPEKEIRTSKELEKDVVIKNESDETDLAIDL